LEDKIGSTYKYSVSLWVLDSGIDFSVWFAFLNGLRIVYIHLWSALLLSCVMFLIELLNYFWNDNCPTSQASANAIASLICNVTYPHQLLGFQWVRFNTFDNDLLRPSCLLVLIFSNLSDSWSTWIAFWVGGEPCRVFLLEDLETSERRWLRNRQAID